MENKEIYDFYRLKILSENDLIHQRMSWFIPLQSFLFISLALYSDKQVFAEHRQWVYVGFSLIGIISAFTTFTSVRAACLALEETMRRWQYEFPKDTTFEIFPALAGGKTGSDINRKGRISGYFLPISVMVFWCALLIWCGLLILNKDINTSTNATPYCYGFNILSDPASLIHTSGVLVICPER